MRCSISTIRSVSLVPKDTKGTPDGARAAAQSAIQDGAELIIGPLFAGEVSGAAPVARQSNIPMIAFSSDQKVAGGGVYLLSFLAGPRRAAHRFLRARRAANAISRCSSRNRPMAGSPRKPLPEASGAAAGRR